MHPRKPAAVFSGRAWDLLTDHWKYYADLSQQIAAMYQDGRRVGTDTEMLELTNKLIQIANVIPSLQRRAAGNKKLPHQVFN